MDKKCVRAIKCECCGKLILEEDDCWYLQEEGIWLCIPCRDELKFESE